MVVVVVVLKQDCADNSRSDGGQAGAHSKGHDISYLRYLAAPGIPSVPGF